MEKRTGPLLEKIGMGKPSRRRATNQPDIRQWTSLQPAHEPPVTSSPQRTSQRVHESTEVSQSGQRRIVQLERVSTGGTRHHVQFQRARSGALSGAERKLKSRAKQSLFPEEQAAARDKDAARKREDRASHEISPPHPEYWFCSKCKRWRWQPTGMQTWLYRSWPSQRLQWWLPDSKPDNGYSSDEEDSGVHWDADGNCVECNQWKVEPAEFPELDDAQMDLLDAAFEEFKLSPYFKSVAPVQRVQRDSAQREFDVNCAAVRAYGFPLLDVPARTVPVPVFTPALVAARASGLMLEARVVDFWDGSRVVRDAIKSWLQELGFHVHVTDDCQQIGPACGYVAARAVNLMYAAGDAWQTIDVSDAAGAIWIDRGNAWLQNGKTQSVFLETQHVYQLAQRIREHDFPSEQCAWNQAAHAWPCMQWPLTIGSRDWVASKLADALMAYVARMPGTQERHFFVTNTQDGRSRGLHWISVAIEMRV